MLPRMKLQGGSGVLRPAPDPPLSVDPPTAYPTSLSIARVPGEVSRQQVAYFFPVASYSWLGAIGSRARQGARPGRGTPIVGATLPSAEGSTMSIPALQECPSSSCQRFVNLSMRNAVYRFSKSIPDGERFFQENLSQFSHVRASASDPPPV